MSKQLTCNCYVCSKFLGLLDQNIDYKGVVKVACDSCWQQQENRLKSHISAISDGKMCDEGKRLNVGFYR